MQNLDSVAQKMSKLCSILALGNGQTDRPTDRQTDICIYRAPMELKMTNGKHSGIVHVIWWVLVQLSPSLLCQHTREGPGVPGGSQIDWDLKSNRDK